MWIQHGFNFSCPSWTTWLFAVLQMLLHQRIVNITYFEQCDYSTLGEQYFPSHSVQPCLASWREDSGIAHHWQDLSHGNYQEMMTISITKLIMWCQPSQLIHITYPQPAAAWYEDSLLCKGLCVCVCVKAWCDLWTHDQYCELLMKWMFHREHVVWRWKWQQ